MENQIEKPKPVGSDALFGRESRELVRFRDKWIGKLVRFKTRIGLVVGVGDDGSQCDGDYRRRYKPTGMLIVSVNECREEDTWPASQVSIIPNANSDAAEGRHP